MIAEKRQSFCQCKVQKAHAKSHPEFCRARRRSIAKAGDANWCHCMPKLCRSALASEEEEESLWTPLKVVPRKHCLEKTPTIPSLCSIHYWIQSAVLTDWLSSTSMIVASHGCLCGISTSSTSESSSIVIKSCHFDVVPKSNFGWPVPLKFSTKKSALIGEVVGLDKIAARMIVRNME